MKPEYHSNCFSCEEAIIFKTSIPYLFQLNLIQYIYIFYYLPNIMSYLVNKKLYLFKMLKSEEKYNHMRKL